jgi:hypothetical protein
MKLPPPNSQAPARRLAPVYVVSGDDPLLCQEAADAIRGAARQQGFDERQVFSADANFDWGTCCRPAPACRCSPSAACWNCACLRASLATRVPPH